MDSSIAVVVVCLVFLSRLMYCSMSALTLWGLTEVLASLSFHTDWRMMVVTKVKGSFWANVSMLKSEGCIRL